MWPEELEGRSERCTGVLSKDIYRLSFPLIFVLSACADIPDDEAQYWTKKLDRINSMRIHDEVQTVCLDGVEMREYVQ